MARDFDNTDDEIIYTTISSQDDVHTLSCAGWFYPRTVGENNAGRLFQKSTASYFMVFTEPTNRVAFFVDWAGTDGRWRTDDSSVAMNAWNHVLVTYNDSSTANVPIIYLNGIAVTVTVVATPTSTRSADTNTFRIGNNTGSSRTFDGYLAETAYWNRILTAGEAKSLGVGFSPAFLKNGLVFYAPIIGNASPEPELKTGITGTLVGTTKAPHPRIIYPSGYNIAPFSAAAAPSAISNKLYQSNQSIKRSNYY